MQVNTPDIDSPATAEREEVSNVGSPTSSIAWSVGSEQDQDQASLPIHNSPFTSGTSPLFSNSFPRRELNGSQVNDSETSSRSSLDGFMTGRETTAEKMAKFRELRAKTDMSSSSSDEEFNDDLTDEPLRKVSKALSEDSVSSARAIDAPRGRIANIRRESNCSTDSDAAHERIMKASQQVSSGFDDISIEHDRKSPGVFGEIRRRAPSFSCGEPITIVTNAFMPHSCSPSPTRFSESIKQCYSPSTQQIVRPNIPYSPSPVHSPCQSPTRNRKMIRSVSPILLSTPRSLKRKLTNLEGDIDAKRCFVRNNTSPLVTDRTFPYPSPAHSTDGEFALPYSVPPSPSSLSESGRKALNESPNDTLNSDDHMSTTMDDETPNETLSAGMIETEEIPID